MTSKTFIEGKVTTNKRQSIDNTLYGRIHYWLRQNYGKPYKCESPNCSKKSKVYDWALLRNKEYDFLRENFIMLCRSCHIKYDFTDQTIEKLRNRMNEFYKTHFNPLKGRDTRKEKICKNCKAIFKTYKPPQIHCSNKCRYEAHARYMLGKQHRLKTYWADKSRQA